MTSLPLDSTQSQLEALAALSGCGPLDGVDDSHNSQNNPLIQEPHEPQRSFMPADPGGSCAETHGHGSADHAAGTRSTPEAAVVPAISRLLPGNCSEDPI